MYDIFEAETLALVTVCGFQWPNPHPCLLAIDAPKLFARAHTPTLPELFAHTPRLPCVYRICTTFYSHTRVSL